MTSVSFDRIADALDCARVLNKIHVPGQFGWVRVHGRQVRVWIPAQTRTVTSVRCHPRYVLRRVRIRGRWRTTKVPVLPHMVSSSTRRVAFGAATTINGWLGTTQGTALGGQIVQILAAPDNGQDAFALEAVAATDANGNWSARLPAGPSRIIKAVYGGGATFEPSSGQATVIVPASIQLRLQARHAHWGGRLVMIGHLRGGYLPVAGEAVILSVFFGGRAHDFANVDVFGNGTFRYVYTFLPGTGDASYPFSAETVRESDYAFAPARSRWESADVSP